MPFGRAVRRGGRFILIVQMNINDNENYNVEDDPNILELDFGEVRHADGLVMPKIKSNLPKHIDEILENKLSELMETVRSICLKNPSIEEILPVFRQDIQISLIREIKNNLDFIRRENIKEQKIAVESIIEEYFFQNSFILALATNNRDKQNKIIEDIRVQHEKLEGDYKGVNWELSIAHDKIKDIGEEKKNKKKNKQRYLKAKKAKKQKALARIEFFESVLPDFRRQFTNDVEHNRKKNGSPNFSALGRIYGVDHKTTKRWCIRYGITLKLPLR